MLSSGPYCREQSIIRPNLFFRMRFFWQKYRMLHQEDFKHQFTTNRNSLGLLCCIVRLVLHAVYHGFSNQEKNSRFDEGTILVQKFMVKIKFVLFLMNGRLLIAGSLKKEQFCEVMSCSIEFSVSASHLVQSSSVICSIKKLW